MEVKVKIKVEVKVVKVDVKMKLKGTRTNRCMVCEGGDQHAGLHDSQKCYVTALEVIAAVSRPCQR